MRKWGALDGSQLVNPLYKDTRFEIVNFDQIQYSRENLILPSFGLTKAADLPTGLFDGCFLAPTSSPFDPAASATEPVDLYASDSYHPNKEFWDWAQDGEGTVRLVFTNNRHSMAGMENAYPYALDNSYAAEEDGDGNPVYSSLYDPGEFRPGAVTGVFGNFSAWFSSPHSVDADISTYARGNYLTVSKGRLLKYDPGATDKRQIARVVRVVTQNSITKVLADFTLTTPAIR